MTQPHACTEPPSQASWDRVFQGGPAPSGDTLANEAVGHSLEQAYDRALGSVLERSAARLGLPAAEATGFLTRLRGFLPGPFQTTHARGVFHRLFTLTRPGEQPLAALAARPLRRIGLAPALDVVLQHLDWFQAQAEEVRIADNFKAGETHSGLRIEPVDAFVAGSGDLDLILLTSNQAEIEAHYRERLPAEKTLSISMFSRAMELRQFSCLGLERARRIVAEIEACEDPLVVLGHKLLATAEPTFVALERAGHDVFVLSLVDKMENQEQSGWDDTCALGRNALVSVLEQLYILTHLRKGRFWIYYDFFHNVGWDAANSVITYARAATMLELASRPVVLGMYDILKPVCRNMERCPEAFALYKVMLDLADAVVLTSKSDHIAEYLRNTLVKDRPVLSFYRYSVPPETPEPRLSDRDGERHFVGVTSFLGEVFEPNRVETRNSIRSMLRQRIHFHYYSDNPKVFAFRDGLPDEERAYFHIEKAIWDQFELIQDMSRFDAGWLVGDEATIFARLIGQIEDRHIRELITLFVPNGVPTSSMAYGAAGLPVFISRQIKVMDEVYPKGCCIPLDMGEVDNLSAVISRLDWTAIHRTMREERHRFSAFHQIGRLKAFLDDLPDTPPMEP